jgi:hypothetical protein
VSIGMLQINIVLQKSTLMITSSTFNSNQVYGSSLGYLTSDLSAKQTISTTVPDSQIGDMLVAAGKPQRYAH